jgi:hypothetical protein
LMAEADRKSSSFAALRMTSGTSGVVRGARGTRETAQI